jgi:hypothetical protein
VDGFCHASAAPENVGGFGKQYHDANIFDDYPSRQRGIEENGME